MTVTFNLLVAEARKLDARWGQLGHRVEAVLGDAEINANDTCFGEKTLPESEWEKVAMSSIELILCYSKDAEVCDWFARQGVRW